jgi:hypothetical protein
MQAWARGTKLDNAGFGQVFLGRDASDPAVEHLRQATVKAAYATNSADLREGAEHLAAAMQAIGLDRWPRFLAEAQQRAADPATFAAVERSNVEPDYRKDGIAPVYPEAAIGPLRAKAIAGAVLGAIVRQVVPKPAGKPAGAPAAKPDEGGTLRPNLQRIHPDSTYEGGSAKLDLNSIRGMSTDDILNSLAPGSREPLTVGPDGRIFDGNTRIKVLQERGYDVNSLPRTPR